MNIREFHNSLHKQEYEKAISLLNSDDIHPSLSLILKVQLLIHKNQISDIFKLISDFSEHTNNELFFKDVLLMRVLFAEKNYHKIWKIKIKWQDKIDKMVENYLTDFFIAQYYEIIGDLLSVSNEFELAINSYVKSSKLYKIINEIYCYYQIQSKIGNRYQQLGIPGDALYHFRESYFAQTNMKVNYNLDKLCTKIINLHLGMGKDQIAREWYEKYKALNNENSSNLNFTELKAKRKLYVL